VAPYAAGAAPVAFNFDWSFDYYPGGFTRPGPTVSIYRLNGGRCAPSLPAPSRPAPNRRAPSRGAPSRGARARR
jgi:hypothetical protein